MVVCLIPPRCPLFEWIRENIISSSCGPRAWSVDSVTSIHFQSPNPNLFLFVWFITAIHLVSFSFLLHLLKPTDKDGEGGTHVQNEKKNHFTSRILSIPEGRTTTTNEGRHDEPRFSLASFSWRERENIIIDFNDHFLFIWPSQSPRWPKSRKKKKKSFHTHKHSLRQQN